MGRLDRLGLFSLEPRRLRPDLIEAHKTTRGLDKVTSHIFPMVEESKTRGHKFKVRRYQRDPRGNVIKWKIWVTSLHTSPSGDVKRTFCYCRRLPRIILSQ